VLAVVAAAKEAGTLRALGPREFILPGFVDTHIHAPQFSYSGTGLDLPLMGPEGWLEQYTFPSERSLGHDASRASAVYSRVVSRTLQNGTTTALYFASLHLEPSVQLARAMKRLGQRGFVGKVCMDRNSPPDYSMDAAANVSDTKGLIERIKEDNSQDQSTKETQSKKTGLVGVAITPRFVPTCTPSLLRQLGDSVMSESASAGVDVVIQTHVAEGLDEVAFCRHLHPPGENLESDSGHICNGRDLSILDQCGLLKRRTVLAHAVHLAPDEVALCAQRGAAISHCPLSNCYFADGVLPVREFKRAGVKIGLGTDVAGGYDPSMLSALRSAVVVSRLLKTGVDCYDHDGAASEAGATSGKDSRKRFKDANLTYQEALYLATVGGAEALGLEDRISRIAVGFEFDALILCVGGGGGLEDAHASLQSAPWSSERVQHPPPLTQSRLDVFPTDARVDLLQKFLHCGDDRDISEVWVQGKRVMCGGNLAVQ